MKKDQEQDQYQEQEQEQDFPSLETNDLLLMKNILDVVAARGAIQASEMQPVGALYNKIFVFLKAVDAIPDEDDENENEYEDDENEYDIEEDNNGDEN